MPKTITLNKAVERMITAVNIVTGDDGQVPGGRQDFS